MGLDLTNVVTSLFESLAISEASGDLQYKTPNNSVAFVTNQNTPGSEVITNVSGFIDTDAKNVLDGTRWNQNSILVGTHFSYEPKLSDILTVFGKDYTIVAIAPVNPSGIDHYYTVQGQS